MPQTKITRINRNGMGYFYDNKGNLLDQHEIPMQSFLEIVSQIKSDPSAVYSILGVKSGEKIGQMIDEAKRKGAVVQDLGNDNISIRYTLSQSSPNARIVGKENYKIVDIVNKKFNILIGSKMYDNKDNNVSETFYSYKLEADNKLSPKAIYSANYNEDAKGKKVKNITNTYFESVSGKINTK
jgi:hypothetical protein